jgi:hypothetical protein
MKNAMNGEYMKSKKQKEKRLAYSEYVRKRALVDAKLLSNDEADYSYAEAKFRWTG